MADSNMKGNTLIGMLQANQYSYKEHISTQFQLPKVLAKAGQDC